MPHCCDSKYWKKSKTGKKGEKKVALSKEASTNAGPSTGRMIQRAADDQVPAAAAAKEED